jgi:hypothetical protein
VRHSRVARLTTIPVLAVTCLLQPPGVTGADAQTAPVPAPFHWHDDYTEYHLRPPETNQFHIVYYVSQRQAGLTYVLNQTRSGSAGSDIAVTNPRTGEPLKFDYMTGEALAKDGVAGRLAASEHYIRAHLPRPVPEGGEGRVRIEKTYADAKSYSADGASLTFRRSLGIGRNLIVLPPGYHLVSSNVAANIMTRPDGRVALIFENINTYAADVSIRAEKRGTPRAYAIAGGPSMAGDFTKVLFELDESGSIRFRLELVKFASGGVVALPLFCDVADAKAFDMDLGRPLAVRPATGNGYPSVAIDPPTPKVGTAHISVTGTLRDPNYQVGPEGVSWQRTFIEPRAMIVLPPGFEVTGVRTPATTGTLPDGRLYVQVVNNRVASAVRLEIWAGRIR